MEDKTQKNNRAPSSPAGHSPLRETKTGGHWYATPGTAAPTIPANQPAVPSAIPGAVGDAQSPLPPGVNPDDKRGGRTRQRIDQRRRQRASGMPQNWAWVVIASALLGLTIVGSMFLVFVVRYALRGNDTATFVEDTRIEPTSVYYAGEGGALDGNSMVIERTKWDGKERFTILLMGLDKRPGESGTAFRSDTMILVSLDPVTNSIGMLSIPRDLYVDVPYRGMQRVNAAYSLGELERTGGGPQLAMQTVQYNFGIRVNEYVTFEFSTVIEMIDAIGGIDVMVERDIVDYSYPTMNYGTEVFQISAGMHHLDGETALKYARTRHASDDIDRAERQQQVIHAAKDKVANLGMIDDLVLQSPQIYANVKSGVSSGLSYDQMVSLVLWVMDVPPGNIHNGIVDWQYVTSYKDATTGAEMLVPRRASIGNLMVQVFGDTYNQ